MKGLFCLVLLSTSLLLWLCGLTAAQELTIANYHLVMGERVGRTTFNYTYRATVTNAGADAQNVTAIVTSTSSDTVVVEGLLTFGSVLAGSTIQSIDTFTIRHDRQVLFAPDVLVVEFQSERVLTRIVETSPANGEVDVAVTRETILRFSRPLAPSPKLLGERALRVSLSQRAALVHLAPLPGSATPRLEGHVYGPRAPGSVYPLFPRLLSVDVHLRLPGRRDVLSLRDHPLQGWAVLVEGC